MRLTLAREWAIEVKRLALSAREMITHFEDGKPESATTTDGAGCSQHSNSVISNLESKEGRGRCFAERKCSAIHGLQLKIKRRW